MALVKQLYVFGNFSSFWVKQFPKISRWKILIQDHNPRELKTGNVLNFPHFESPYLLSMHCWVLPWKGRKCFLFISHHHLELPTNPKQNFPKIEIIPWYFVKAIRGFRAQRTFLLECQIFDIETLFRVRKKSLVILSTVSAPLKPVVCILFTHFLKSKNVFSRGFFLRILALCMVSIQEWVMMAGVR